MQSYPGRCIDYINLSYNEIQRLFDVRDYIDSNNLNSIYAVGINSGTDARRIVIYIHSKAYFETEGNNDLIWVTKMKDFGKIKNIQFSQRDTVIFSGQAIKVEDYINVLSLANRFPQFDFEVYCVYDMIFDEVIQKCQEETVGYAIREHNRSLVKNSCIGEPLF